MPGAGMASWPTLNTVKINISVQLSVKTGNVNDISLGLVIERYGTLGNFEGNIGPRKAAVNEYGLLTFPLKCGF